MIPYESTEKNMTLLGGFLTKKSQKFWYFYNKNIFKLNFGYFRPLLEFVKDFFFNFEVFRNEIFNIMFFFLLFFTSKVVYLMSQVKNTLNIYIFMLLKDSFVVWQPFIFLSVFTILVTIAVPHLKFTTRVSPSIILTQQ